MSAAYVNREDDSGQLVFSLPVPTDLQMPWTDPMTSLGPMVAANLREPQKYHGHSIPVVNELLSTQMIAQQFSEVTGLKARWDPDYIAYHVHTVRLLLATACTAASLWMLDQNLRQCSWVSI